MEISVIFSYIEKLKKFSLLHLYYNLINIAYYGKNSTKCVLIICYFLRYQGKDVYFVRMTSQITFIYKNFIIIIQYTCIYMYKPLFQYLVNYEVPANYWKLTLYIKMYVIRNENKNCYDVIIPFLGHDNSRQKSYNEKYKT